MNSLVHELGRRNVLRAAAAYVVFGWIELQVLDVVVPILLLPACLPRALLVLLAIGFAFTLFVSWVYEVTPEGIRRTSEVAPEASIAAATGRRLDRLVLAGLVLAIGAVALDRWWPRTKPFEAPAPNAVVAEKAAPTDPAATVSIAVLPFSDLSAARDQEYFGDGLAEELLNVLARVDGLSVSSRTSSFAFKGKTVPLPEIAQTLKVDHIVEGSVRKAGERLRVTAQLIDVATDRHLWSQTYERTLDDVFAIQDEIARSIAEALRVTLDRGPASASGTTDVAAYDLYLLGVYYWNRRTPEGLASAQQYFERAIERDERFARAWAGLSMTLTVLPGYAGADSGDILPRALAAARRAVELDPDGVEGRTALGEALDNVGERALAIAAFDRAIAIDPKYATAHHWKGIVLTEMRDFEGGEAEIRIARALDPGSLPSQSYLTQVLRMQGHTAEALAESENVLARAPDYRNALELSFHLGHALGRTREYLPRLRRFFVVLGEDPALGDAIVDSIEQVAQRPEAAARLRAAVPRLRGRATLSSIANLLLLVGEHQAAIDLIEPVYEDQSPYLIVTPELAKDPLYAAWRERMERAP